MCADAQFRTAGLTVDDLPALRAFAATHGIVPIDCGEHDGALSGSLLRITDGQGHMMRMTVSASGTSGEYAVDDMITGICWCDAAGDDVEGLRAVLRWLAGRGATTFRPDTFDYLLSGEAVVAPEDVPPPIMGDGRVLTINVTEG